MQLRCRLTNHVSTCSVAVIVGGRLEWRPVKRVHCSRRCPTRPSTKSYCLIYFLAAIPGEGIASAKWNTISLSGIIGRIVRNVRPAMGAFYTDFNAAACTVIGRRPNNIIENIIGQQMSLCTFASLDVQFFSSSLQFNLLGDIGFFNCRFL